jgi:uncharacterized protein (DUF1800 family)
MMIKAAVLVLLMLPVLSGLRAGESPPLAPLTLPPEAETTMGALHALDRLGFGPRPFEVEQVRQMGVSRWIARQLNPASIPEPEALSLQLAALPTLTESNVELYRRQMMLNRDKSDSGQEAKKDFDRTVLQEAATARIDRALLSDRQLQEVLVGFWFNHFNVFRGKGLDHVWVGSFESESIRPYVFGRFRTLLEATARHPAMLFYLDNWQNSAPGSHTRQGKELGLNENYARELMELHTLGVDGGYNQQDVTELARILTGWGLRDRAERSPSRLNHGSMLQEADYSLAFDPSRHDFGEKHFLGHVIKGEGWREVELALDILAAHPATAHHLSFQLAQYFVADQPDPRLVDKMAESFLKSGGNLTVVMRTMIESPLFWSPQVIGHKFKTPFEYAVSALRASNVTPARMQPVLGLLGQLGQPIYGIETPDGYKQVESAWLNPDAMARRLSFATMLGGGRLADQTVTVSDAALRSVLPSTLSPQTERALGENDAKLRPIVLLGSPDFMHR